MELKVNKRKEKWIEIIARNQRITKHSTKLPWPDRLASCAWFRDRDTRTGGNEEVYDINECLDPSNKITQNIYLWIKFNPQCVDSRIALKKTVYLLLQPLQHNGQQTEWRRQHRMQHGVYRAQTAVQYSTEWHQSQSSTVQSDTSPKAQQCRVTPVPKLNSTEWRTPVPKLNSAEWHTPVPKLTSGRSGRSFSCKMTSGGVPSTGSELTVDII